MKSWASARRAASWTSAVGGVGAAVADVVVGRAVEHRRLLPDRADLRAQRVLGQVADVGAVEQDAPALDLVEPQEQRDRGGLAGAGAADQRHPLAGADVEGEAVERRRSGGRSRSGRPRSRPRRGCAPGATASSASTMVCGGDRVRMPSSISPTLEKTPIAVIDTQPDICASRVAIRPAVAMSPAVAAPRVQSSSVPPISTTGRHAGERHQPEAEGGRGRRRSRSSPRGSRRARRARRGPRAGRG